MLFLSVLATLNSFLDDFLNLKSMLITETQQKSHLIPLYQRETITKQLLSEVLTDIKSEFKRLKLVTNVTLVGCYACVEIFQANDIITFSHEAVKLLSLLQMYDPKFTKAD